MFASLSLFMFVCLSVSTLLLAYSRVRVHCVNLAIRLLYDDKLTYSISSDDFNTVTTSLKLS